MLTERESGIKIKCSNCGKDLEWPNITWVTRLPGTAIYNCSCGLKTSSRRITDLVEIFLSANSYNVGNVEKIKDFVVNELGNEWIE